MNPSSINKTVDQINLITLQSYLTNKGWERVQGKKDKIAIYRLVRNESILGEVIFPQDKSFIDFKKAIINAIEIISEIENKSFQEILIDITQPPSDILRFRIENDETKDGTIALLDGIQLIENAKLALIATVCDEIQPEQFHKRLSSKEAKGFINKCRLGQTEVGSYIATIVCPFIGIDDLIQDSENPKTLFPGDLNLLQSSFTRKVTTRLVKSVQHIKNYIDQDRAKELYTWSDNTEFISGNFYDALIELFPKSGKTTVEISSNWARTVPPIDDTPDRVNINSDYLPAIELVANNMRPKDKIMSGPFFGKIDSLKADAEVNERSKGEVTFLFILDDNIAHAKINLSKEDYDKACDAHKEGKPVRIDGDLKLVGRTKYIEYKSLDLLN